MQKSAKGISAFISVKIVTYNINKNQYADLSIFNKISPKFIPDAGTFVPCSCVFCPFLLLLVHIICKKERFEAWSPTLPKYLLSPMRQPFLYAAVW